jgi:hypothetical protein
VSGHITGLLQHRRHHNFRIGADRVFALIAVMPRPERIAARQQLAPRWPAQRSRVAVCELRPALGHRIDVRRLEWPTVRPDIAQPHVVGEDQNNIRMLFRGRRRRRRTGGNEDDDRN